MSLNDQQYERVASWLDGEDIELSTAERAVAEEIRGDQALLAATIELRRPRRALARAQRRMSAELARPSRRKVWLGWLTAAESVAVAAVVVAVMTIRVVTPNGSDAIGRPSWASLPNELFYESLELITNGDDEIEDVRVGLEALEAEVLVSNPPSVTDMEMEDLQQKLEEFWLDESWVPLSES